MQRQKTQNKHRKAEQPIQTPVLAYDDGGHIIMIIMMVVFTIIMIIMMRISMEASRGLRPSPSPVSQRLA